MNKENGESCKQRKKYIKEIKVYYLAMNINVLNNSKNK